MSDLTTDLGADDGIADFKIGEVTVAVDVLRVNNMIADIQTRAEGKPPEVELDEISGLIEKLGFPRPSHHLANKFIAAVVATKKKLLGNGGPAPAPTA